MIKYLIAFMLFILFTSPCLAGMGTGGFPYPGPGAMVNGGGTPATYTVQGAEYYYSDVPSTKLFGQSWTVDTGQGGVLTEVIFYSTTAYTGTVTCRVGTSDDQIDMTSNYVAGSGEISGIGEFTVTFSGGPTVSSGSTYAVACHHNSASAVRLGVSLTNLYANGTEYLTTAADWDLTGHNDPVDFYFKYTVNQ